MISFCKKNSIDILFAFFLLGFVFSVTPTSYFNIHPASGGDTGSHFYTLSVLFHEALPHFRIRTWDPGHIMGEAEMLFYFPGPFLFMAFLGLFMPLGLAFNLGTLAPLFGLALSIYFALRAGLRASALQSLLGASASFLVLFNEGQSMWGGNALSLLAGQFAHLYALNFLFVTIGFLGLELENKWPPLASAVAISAVAICHSYILLLVPLFFWSFQLIASQDKQKQTLFHLLRSGAFALLLSLWFLVPQFIHAPWTTANPMTWYYAKPWDEIFPLVMRPLATIGIGLFPVLGFLIFKKKILGSSLKLQIYFWLMPIFGSLVYFEIFPHFGLVDARTLPQIQLFAALAISQLLALALSPLPRKFFLTLIIGLSVVAGAWTFSQIHNFPHWIRWNYGGWENKQKYPALLALVGSIKSDFSHPRIVNEHNPSLNSTGSTRVFELLPYFAHRSTMETLYAESSWLAPLTHWLQARISEQPSCPVRSWPCVKMEFTGLDRQLGILGVSDMILVSPAAQKEVLKNPAFFQSFKVEDWQVFSLKNKPELVEVLTEAPLTLSREARPNLQRTFYDWFIQNKNKYLLYDPDNLWGKENIVALDSTHVCRPSLTVDYNKIDLRTNCPGRPHLIKFSYHPAWKNLQGEHLYPISPGFILLVPHSSEVNLRWGYDWRWTISSILSILTLLFLLLGFLLKRFKRSAL